MSILDEYKYAVERKIGQMEQIEKRISELEKDRVAYKKDAELSSKAQEIIQSVAKATQEELEYHISDLVSLALASVFDNPYKLDVKFEIKRGKTECQLSFVRGDVSIHPMTASGGGAVDIASFGLRVALWSLSRPRTAPILLIDEPFKHLSRNMHGKASEMLSTISKRLGVQIIMVSHSDDLIDCADKTFIVNIKNGVSNVTAM